MAEKKKKRRINRKRLIIPVYIMIIILLVIIVYVFPSISGALTRTTTIEYGDLQISSKVTCYIVKNETVYFAQESGDVGYYYTQGQQVRGGTEILSMTPSDADSSSDYEKYRETVGGIINGNTVLTRRTELYDSVLSEVRDSYLNTPDITEARKLAYYVSQLENLPEDSSVSFSLSSGSDDSVDLTQIGIADTYKTSSSGILSYILDGYESDFNPYTMALIDKDRVENLDISQYNFCTGKAVKGQPLFKIVDNSSWYAVTWISASELGKYEDGKSITLKLPEGDVSGTVDSFIDIGDEIMLIMKFNSYYEGLAETRKVTAELVTSDCSGLMIDNSYLTSVDGVVGVYVVGVTGGETFTPVNVKDSYDGYSIVSSGSFYQKNEEGEVVQVSTVEVYDEIKKPD